VGDLRCGGRLSISSQQWAIVWSFRKSDLFRLVHWGISVSRAIVTKTRSVESCTRFQLREWRYIHTCEKLCDNLQMSYTYGVTEESIYDIRANVHSTKAARSTSWDRLSVRS
jgi:hypothetical protein